MHARPKRDLRQQYHCTCFETSMMLWTRLNSGEEMMKPSRLELDEKSTHHRYLVFNLNLSKSGLIKCSE